MIYKFTGKAKKTIEIANDISRGGTRAFSDGCPLSSFGKW